MLENGTFTNWHYLEIIGVKGELQAVGILRQAEIGNWCGRSV